MPSNAAQPTGADKPTGTTRKRYGIRLDRTAFEAYCKRVGLVTDTEKAGALGVNVSTIYRIQAGKVDPSMDFVAAALTRFRHARFEDLFVPYVKAA